MNHSFRIPFDGRREFPRPTAYALASWQEASPGEITTDNANNRRGRKQAAVAGIFTKCGSWIRCGCRDAERKPEYHESKKGLGIRHNGPLRFPKLRCSMPEYQQCGLRVNPVSPHRGCARRWLNSHVLFPEQFRKTSSPLSDKGKDTLQPDELHRGTRTCLEPAAISAL